MDDGLPSPILFVVSECTLLTEKYKEMILDAAETVLGYFGFDRTVYGSKRNKAERKWWWLEELRQEREKDIKVEMMGTGMQ